MRGRRDTALEEPVDEAVIEALLDLDHMDCGKRYLCDLASSPVDSLTKEERATLDIFQGKTRLESTSLGRILFGEAVTLGTNTRDISICQARYKSCDIGKSSMMELIRSLEQPNLQEINAIY